MDPFDTAAISAGMKDDEARKAEFVAWCLTALEGFIKAAGEVGTPVVGLEIGSLAFRAAGVGAAPWPRTQVDDKEVAQYYRILTYNGRDGAWPALDGYGLTQSLDGQIFLRSKVSNEIEAAAYLGKATGYDLDAVKELFNAALRGEALAFAD
jgi:hypothetical protein